MKIYRNDLYPAYILLIAIFLGSWFYPALPESTEKTIVLWFIMGSAGIVAVVTGILFANPSWLRSNVYQATITLKVPETAIDELKAKGIKERNIPAVYKKAIEDFIEQAQLNFK